uniref:ATP binding cassette subfamily A member 6 n=1 Tax=Bos indicus x Bos taurus TaxID=30522 RepID=A0A4W2I3E4_BOBOX
MHMKQKSVYQQTQALLCKNLLKKWRMKRETLLEWGFPILLALYMCIFSRLNENVRFPGMPPQNLGRVDKYNRSFTDVVYTPVSNLTQQIMNKTALAPVMEGRCANGQKLIARVQILMTFPSIMLVLLPLCVIIAYCKRTHIDFSCALEKYWKGGFVPLQAAINAAIIQVTTNHYVMEELMSVTAVNMKTLPFIFKENLQNEMFIFYCLLYFSPLIYFLSLNVARERKKYKDLMNLMGLQDSAFWLSWGLIYAAFIFVTSIIITVIITSTEIIILTGFTVIFTLFFLYGLSLIALAFLMTVLLKKTILTSLVVFLLTLFWGGVGLSAFYQQLPSPLKWIFSICSPFAFSAGINQVRSEELESNIYGNESHYSPLFFLNSSPCFQHRRTGSHVTWKDVDPEPAADEYCEPVAPELHGREAIRIRNVKKVYKEKTGKVEVLKGLSFDIYEGQITAVLGHSGAGKSALLRILSGSSVPTAGSVTIYNKNLSEMQDLEEIRKITGVCPQFNVQFDTLTVKENLRLFAKIKGIQPKDVEQEVQRVLLELDIQNIQDNLATLLSEGQKRKLTIGIALLGDPQVLLLDEPTAGLDPFSRHRIWNFLRERKADRVILLSTNLMDEADMLADRKVILSKGRLKCAGSSVFLKRRWGLGYHLSLYRNETCDPEKITSLINHHIPDAKLKTESKEKLVYTLPAERTNKFPDLFSDLDEDCSLGVLSYEVSTSTLNEVFTKLEGNSMAEQGTSIRMRHGRPISKWSCVSLVSRVSCVWLSPRTRHIPDLTVLFGKVAVFPLIVESIFYAMLNETADLEFKPELYFLSPGQLPQGPRTSLLIINNTESNIEDFIQSLKHQNIILEVDDFENRNGTEDPSYNGAIIVSGKRKDYGFSVVCNTKQLHCFPVLMSVVSNALLRMFNQTQRIRTERSSYPLVSAGFARLPSWAVDLSPYIAMNSVSDYKKRTKSQLWISGLFPSAYWCGQALVDVSLYSLMLLAMYLIFYLANREHIYLTSRIVVLTLGYAASLVSLMYVIAFIFRKRRKNSGLWSFCFYIVSIYTNSSFSNFQCNIKHSRVSKKPTCCVFHLFCRISPQSRDARSNAEEPIGEDEDVQAERIRTATALNTSIEEKPVIIASCLHKEYAGQKKRCFSRRRKKTAVRNVSFCVKKGEILGLLGPNGAGKSSSVRMISGMTTPTAGEVGDISIRFLGYCPQENVLWPSLTTREHLEVFAAVKGLRRADAHMAISRLVDAFRLHEQLDVPVQKLSGGAARKLCFVLSLLGDPPILLLDEPSTGLDPAEQKQLAVRNTARGALLTTHSMAEAEAVCDRVAIMVSGRLRWVPAKPDKIPGVRFSQRVFLLVRRCIGSIQHLKNSLGKDYILELKLKEASQGMSVHTEVLRLFPRAALQERYSSSSAYRLPVQDVQPLSQAFHKLETVKRNFNLEEYSLSQCTLGKVFLELSKEQELGNVDEEVNTTMRWKLLCHSEGP